MSEIFVLLQDAGTGLYSIEPFGQAFGYWSGGDKSDRRYCVGRFSSRQDAEAEKKELERKR